MKILITNHFLSVRAGTESFVRDLARSLQARGHTVIAYTSDLSRGSRLLERDLIPVTTDPGNLPVFPDIIHAQHPLDAMTALAALPGVPAIYHERGGPWQSTPPIHPRIHHYLSNSGSVASEWQTLSTMSSAAISHFPDSVDTARFFKVRKPASRPTRALLVDSRVTEQSPYFTKAREVARKCGLALDLGGPQFAPGGFDTECILPEYDLVFASGPTALEALACGCMVMVTSPDGFCELLQQENFERLQRNNFLPDPSAYSIPIFEMETLLRRCNPDHNALLSEQVRQKSNFSTMVPRLIDLYERVLEIQRHSHTNLLAESIALSNFLKSIQPLIMQATTTRDGIWPMQIAWQLASIPVDSARHG